MESKQFRLIRHWSDFNQTTGTLLIVDMDQNCQPIFGSLCIERGARNNQQMVSNIPAGTYPIVWEWSPAFKRMLWEIKDVPGRSECKIHPSNYWKQLNGCIAPGIKLKDMDSDGYYDVTSSGPTIDAMHRVMKGITKTFITIVDEY